MTFGELSEEATDKRKYAKYKAAYIHTCLRSGETPVPGPPTEDGESDDNNFGGPTNPADDDATTPSNEPSTSEPNDPSPPPGDHSPIEFRPHPNPTEINGKIKLFMPKIY